MHVTTEKEYLLRGIYPKEIKQIVYKNVWSNLHPSIIKEKINKSILNV